MSCILVAPLGLQRPLVVGVWWGGGRPDFSDPLLPPEPTSIYGSTEGTLGAVGLDETMGAKRRADTSVGVPGSADPNLPFSTGV
jgi:hypothetical protein